MSLKNNNEVSNVKIKVKKNIDVLKTKNKKNQMIKVKNDIYKKKSMGEALKDNEVLLWGINQIDSVILKPYELNYKKPETKNTDKNNSITNIENQYKKTTDIKYFSGHKNKYNYLDLDFLNSEYERIDKEISSFTELGDEFDKMMEIQDELGELIEELEYDKKTLEQEKNNSDVLIKHKTTISDTETESDLDSESDLKKKSKKSKKSIRRAKILKPYYWVGKIPDGYRESTQEEAILKKKVSWFGKKKVSKQMYDLHNVTGTLFVEDLKPRELSLKIASLRGKLTYYRKQIDYYKISLDSDNISSDSIQNCKSKIEEFTDCYKKTLNVLEQYLEQQEKSNSSIVETKTEVTINNK
jgi:hypothetical protein